MRTAPEGRDSGLSPTVRTAAGNSSINVKPLKRFHTSKLSTFKKMRASPCEYSDYEKHSLVDSHAARMRLTL